MGQDKFVGIGIASPTAKLHVVHTMPNSVGQNMAVAVDLFGANGSTTINYGIYGAVSGEGQRLLGV